MITFHDRLIT